MAMAMRSDKLKSIQCRASCMRANLTMLFAVCVLLPAQVVAASPATSSPASAAPNPAPAADPTPQALNTTAAPSQSSALDAAQQPVPDDATLTAPGLGRAFEAFQPSEAISADNAVPFPTNI